LTKRISNWQVGHLDLMNPHHFMQSSHDDRPRHGVALYLLLKRALIPASPHISRILQLAVIAQPDQRTFMNVLEASDVSGCSDDGIKKDRTHS
jgi:hypothetical protein